MLRRAAHPRSRGEHKHLIGGESARLGSSPLARGTLNDAGEFTGSARLIPARAGNITSRHCFVLGLAAHPRSRGEHTENHSFLAPGFGSSPLARGTWYTLTWYRYRLRLIPARAGNITTSAPVLCASSAHPRSRGEHGRNQSPTRRHLGSSPLARGTLGNGARLVVRVRLIPARAGNILADMGVYPLHQQNRITLKPEPHPGYTINSHS